MERVCSTIILLLSCGWLMVTCNPHGRDSVEIMRAINSGGPRHKVNNIIYSADQTPSEGTLVWPYPFGGVSGAEEVPYKTCRFSQNNTGFTYHLPVDGDGWYGLAMQSSVYAGEAGQYLYNVTLNGNAVILPFYDPFDQCGLFNVCNEIRYFFICDGMLYWKGGNGWISSKVVKNRVPVNFDKYGYVDAVVLAKGKAGHAKTVIKDKLVLYFDPVTERKCHKRHHKDHKHHNKKPAKKGGK